MTPRNRRTEVTPVADVRTLHRALKHSIGRGYGQCSRTSCWWRSVISFL